MADRAQYLARTLVARLADLQASCVEDGRVLDRRQRMAAIEKVFAIELGITDGATLSLIESAVPATLANTPSSDRDIVRFAAFLRERLARHLAG